MIARLSPVDRDSQTTPNALDELASCLTEAASIEGVDAQALAQLNERVAQGCLNLVVAGAFKRGKSTLINALLGAEVVPVGVIPVTSAVTILQNGLASRATVEFLDGEERVVPLSEFKEYATERGNPGNAKGVREVVISYPSPWLRGGTRLIDTPGIGSIYVHNTDVVYRFLPQADAVLFVASADQPMGLGELEFLKDIRRYASKVICVLNKIDYLEEEDREESAAFTASVVRKALGAAVPVIPISARWALQAKAKASDELLARSGFALLGSTLERFLAEEKEGILLVSVANHLRRALSEVRLANVLEDRSLSAPLERLKANLGAFALKKTETLRSRFDVEVLLAAETRKLLKDEIEPALQRFAGELTLQMSAAVEQWFAEHRAVPLRELQGTLNERLIVEIRSAYDEWRAQEDAHCARVFDALCLRFWTSIQDTVDQLLRYSADLFSVPFEAKRTASLWQPSSDFYYKFWDEPPALRQLGTALALGLPRVLGERLLRARMQETAADLVDTQAGRVRHSFEERLKQGVRDFHLKISDRVDTTVAAIERAIRSGAALRERDEAEVAMRRRELSLATARIAALESQLIEIVRPTLGDSA